MLHSATTDTPKHTISGNDLARAWSAPLSTYDTIHNMYSTTSDTTIYTISANDSARIWTTPLSVYMYTGVQDTQEMVWRLERRVDVLTAALLLLVAVLL